MDRPPEGKGWGHEIKLDGYRLQLRIEGGEATLLTRKGLDWTDKFSSIAKAAAALPDSIIDGEAVVLDAQGVSSFPELQAALSDRDGSQLVFFVFDLLFEGDEDLRRLPLRGRKRRLKALLKPITARKSAVIRFVDHFETAGLDPSKPPPTFSRHFGYCFKIPSPQFPNHAYPFRLSYPISDKFAFATPSRSTKIGFIVFKS